MSKGRLMPHSGDDMLLRFISDNDYLRSDNKLFQTGGALLGGPKDYGDVSASQFRGYCAEAIGSRFRETAHTDADGYLIASVGGSSGVPIAVYKAGSNSVRLSSRISDSQKELLRELPGADYACLYWDGGSERVAALSQEELDKALSGESARVSMTGIPACGDGKPVVFYGVRNSDFAEFSRCDRRAESYRILTEEAARLTWRYPGAEKDSRIRRDFVLSVCKCVDEEVGASFGEELAKLGREPDAADKGGKPNAKTRVSELKSEMGRSRGTAKDDPPKEL